MCERVLNVFWPHLWLISVKLIGFARKQIELFEAKQEDVDAGAQGRNKPIILGQVGIRCIHVS